jgi:hypothetical protein
MCRDFNVMRRVLMTVAGSDEPVQYGAFMLIEDEDAVMSEIRRLDRDGLIETDIAFQNGTGYCMGGRASITEEGREFLNFIENDRVWELMRTTLDAAGIDVPYPLLKEVCEEIVERYVASFIPDIEPRR